MNYLIRQLSSVIAGTVLIVPAICAGADPGLEIFENKIRPILVEKCIACHGPEEQEGGLRVDSQSGWTVGGDSGTAIVPEQPDDSLLLRAIRYADPDLQMPPDGKLSSTDISAFEAWIRLGATDPRTGRQTLPNDVAPVGRASWAFATVRRPKAPAVQRTTWPKTEIDRFVLAEIEAHGLNPVHDATKTGLIRRVYYDLTGLPPTVRQIDEFLSDNSPDAFANLVDTLLDSPHFGERWGRRWLDVVRFAESSGGGRTLLFPDAWRYRDYVIDAFQDDMPYDVFVTEQLAGDLLDASSPQIRRRRLIATAFLLLGPTNFELQDKDVLEMDIIDEQLDTIGKSLLGMTIGCARCHDHKFDPILTQDYYGLAGILKSTQFVVHDNVSTWTTVDLPLLPDDEARLASRQIEVAAIERELKRARQKATSSGEVATDNGDPLMELERRLAKLKSGQSHREVAMAVADAAEPNDLAVAVRGQTHNRGEVVIRGAISAVEQVAFAEIPDHSSGRLLLAEWITDPAHPLTARVIVNRVWHWLIGAGIVPTVDNFGTMGEPPSHPELLDHLAINFIADGWSIKRLIREIMLSHVYQLSAAHDVRNYELDPDNRWLWRMPRRRLEAEEIRDTLLFVSDQLDLRRGGPNIKQGTKKEYGYTFTSARRSVYVPVFRNQLPEIFEVFDFADPNIQGGRRSVSTIAPQALLLMNHPFVIKHSRLAAERQLGLTGMDDGQRVELAYREVLGRRPTLREHELAATFVKGAGHERPRRWAMLYQSLIQSLDFRYLN